ncbi:hypothetical protein KA344_10215 [bacterium]|nr:hypothetical protein [bacterium]
MQQSHEANRLAIDFKQVLENYTKEGHGSACLPQLKNVSDDNDLVNRLIIAANAGDQTERAKDAKNLLNLAYLSMAGERVEQLSSAIANLKEQSEVTGKNLSASLDSFNHASVTTLSDKLQAFVDALKTQAEDSGKQASHMLTESKWLGRFTALLAGATVWLAFSTQLLASEAVHNMASDNAEKELAGKNLELVAALAIKQKELQGSKQQLSEQNARILRLESELSKFESRKKVGKVTGQ